MTDLQRDLRRVRRAKELSQGDVAARAGLTQQGLYVIEKRARPSLDAICRVAAVLGYRVALVPIDNNGDGNALRNGGDNGDLVSR